MLPAASTLGLKADVNWPMGEVFAAQPELLDLRLSSESKLTMEALKLCKALPLHFISLHTYPGGWRFAHRRSKHIKIEPLPARSNHHHGRYVEVLRCSMLWSTIWHEMLPLEPQSCVTSTAPVRFT